MDQFVNNINPDRWLIRLPEERINNLLIVIEFRSNDQNNNEYAWAEHILFSKD